MKNNNGYEMNNSKRRKNRKTMERIQKRHAMAVQYKKPLDFYDDSYVCIMRKLELK